MNKILKVSLLLLLFIFIFSSVKSFATNTDINMSLDSTNTSNNATSSNVTNSNTLRSNSGLETTTENQEASATFSNISSLPESELGLTNILNILLITVGVVLILLSIAIFIRLKNI